MEHWANDYIGIPFSEKGYDRSGCNCWGLVRLILAERFSVFLPDYKDEYNNTDDPLAAQKIVDESISQWAEISSDQVREGDVVVIMMKSLPSHVGLMIDRTQMVHVETRSTSCSEKVTSRKWKDRVVGFYRHKSMMD